MLNSTFRMESHLRVFGLTNQLNIVFKRPLGWRERPPGNSSSCSPIRDRRWELSLQSESCDAWSAAFALDAEGRSEAGSNRPLGSVRDAEDYTAKDARSARSGAGSRSPDAPSAESSWRRSHTSRVLNTGIRSEGEEFRWSCAFSAGRGNAGHRSRLITPWR